MKPITMLMKSNNNQRSDVYGNYEYGCRYAISTNTESMIRKRGLHLTDDEIKDILHNLPKEFKPMVRFIKDESQIKHYEPATKVVKEKFDDVKEAMKKTLTKTKEKSEDVASDAVDKFNKLMAVDYSKLNDKELVEHKNKLKVYAKENNIKVHPALKDVARITEIIKENS